MIKKWMVLAIFNMLTISEAQAESGFTPAQKKCIDRKVGEYNPITATTSKTEDLMRALKTCKVDIEKTLTLLQENYHSAASEEIKKELRSQMVTLFYGSASEDTKNRIRKFLKENTLASDRAPASSVSLPAPVSYQRASSSLQ